MKTSEGELQHAGRRVSWALFGRAIGRRVHFQYGTPGTRSLSPSMIDAVDRAGVQLLVLDRPGYGASDRLPGRRVTDVVADVDAVADALAWDDFAVWGGSGGAPHALACAAGMRGRVTRVASVVGPAPFDAPGLDWFAGMSPGNVEEFSLAAIGEAQYRPLVTRLAHEAVSAVSAGGSPVAEGYDLPPQDKIALHARQSEDGHEARIQAAYIGGIDGWVDDCIAMTRPWGFDLTAIEAPVSVWFGPNDVLSPRGHAEFLLAALPAASSRLLAGGGHLLRDEDLDAVYGWLAG